MYDISAFIFPFRMKNPTPMYISIMAQAFFFNLVNGPLQGIQVAYGEYTSENLYTWQFILGVIVFISGWYINYQSDDILRNLRKPGEERKYKIPYGGAFNWVTAANYFGEIVEWTGWGLATWSVAGFSFALFTFANLAPRGATHHKWYLQKFGKEYPKNRRAVIPYIW